jgi:TPR repeat protein
MAGRIYQRCVSLALPFAFVPALWITPSLAHEFGQLRQAENAITAHRYAEAQKILKPLADAGDPRAEWLLGDLYLNGRGVPRNFTRARDYWQKAAAVGDQDAMCSLGLLLSVGLGGPTDLKRAVSLFEKSASMGSTQAQCYMGLECIWRTEGHQDYPRAVKYFESAAKRQDGNACWLLCTRMVWAL